jgi:diaminopimelate decarboxylase
MSTHLNNPLTEPALADLLAARPALAMHGQDGLCFEGVPLNAIADAHGTPTWVYGAGSLRSRYAALVGAFAAAGLAPHIHYAVKANDHLAILNILRQAGAGADVVSRGEFLRAQKAGIAPENIVFSGVGKTADDLTAALAANTLRHRRRHRQNRPHCPAHEPGCRCRHPRQNHDRPRRQ